MPSSRAGGRSSLFDPANLDWGWDFLLREARPGRRAPSRGGPSLPERHGGASLRGAGRKSQIPKPKSQVNPKRGKVGRLIPFENWEFEFTWDLELGIWDFRFSGTSGGCGRRHREF